MVLFESMSTVTLYTCLAVLILLWVGTGKNPLSVGAEFIRQLIFSRKYLIHFVLVLVILLLNKVELMIEAGMAKRADFTGLFSSIEGGFVSGIQHLFEHPVLTTVLSFMYIVVFQALLISSIGVYTFRHNKTMYYAVCYAVMINYLIAIPFYLYFPVLEVWAYDSSVRFILLDAFPTFESQYRELSGLDNCFPSLHTSISVTLAMLALRSGNKRWAWICGISALTIIFSIFYLGIHWLIDMLGGFALGLFASSVGMRLSTRRQLLRPWQSPVSQSVPSAVQRDHAG